MSLWLTLWGPHPTPPTLSLLLRRTLGLSFSMHSTKSGCLGCSERAEDNTSRLGGLHVRTVGGGSGECHGLPRVTGETTGIH